MAALFGLEFISVLEEEQRLGIKINDPANPGRAYVCGKGIPAPNDPTEATERRMRLARAMNEARAEQMTERMRGLFAEAGLDMDIDASAIVAQVAARNDVPATWVVLQERHVALGFQELLFERLDPEDLQRVPGRIALPKVASLPAGG